MTIALARFRSSPSGAHLERCRAARVLPLLFLSGLAGLGAGCSPAINSFYVQPEAYCPSTTQIRIVWDASGDTFVTTAPADHIFHNDKGDENVTAEPMSVVIEARRNHRQKGAPTINVGPVQSTRPMVGQAGFNCDATNAKTSTIPVGPNVYDVRSSVSAISNLCTSNDPADPCPIVTVCHGPDPTNVCANAWHIPPGRSVALTGVGMTGYWQLARSLLPNETCGPGADAGTQATTATAPPPGQHQTHLKVQLTLVCT